MSRITLDRATEYATTVAATADVERVLATPMPTGTDHHEITDGSALVIASWWQSSGTIGSRLAELASTRSVDVDALLDDIAATRTHDQVSGDDARALDCLATWAINHPSRTD